MGQEIVYCFDCRTRLLASDFEKGAAFRFEDRVACAECAKKHGASLPEPAPQPQPQPPSTRRLSAASGRSGGTTSRRPGKRTAPIGLILLGVGALACLAFIVAALTSGGDTNPRGDTPETPPAPPPITKEENPQHERARQALERARKLPSSVSLDDRIEAFEKAERETFGTPYHETTREALNALRVRLRQILDDSYQELDTELRPLLAREEFKSAFDLLREHRKLHPSPQWPARLEVRMRTLNDDIETRFDALKKRAGDARRRGDDAGVKKERDRVAGWGVPVFAAKLQKHLSTVRSQPGLRQGLVGWWMLNETEGKTAANAVTPSQPGKVEGNPKWTEGGLAFDGDGDRIVLPSSPEIRALYKGNYTLSAWFKPADVPPGKGSDNTARYGILILRGYHSGITYRDDGKFAVGHYIEGNKQVGTASTTSFPPATFHHVASVLDAKAGSITLYVNGKRRNVRNWDPAPARDYGSTPWRIGTGAPTSASYRWDAKGVIDDVRMYARTLSAEEVSQLHAAGRGH